ncbi:uncharacterized protein LOC114747191 [Neltuma alba]|uniref:uncharacterized protein LOC114747191 n=1 Tax=Neltuma alba TaxID=207710 RepID=UPI0010A580A5|nr:uncharacterized protein LOC114747191 [Prosopis alba]
MSIKSDKTLRNGGPDNSPNTEICQARELKKKKPRVSPKYRVDDIKGENIEVEQNEENNKGCDNKEYHGLSKGSEVKKEYSKHETKNEHSEHETEGKHNGSQFERDDSNSKDEDFCLRGEEVLVDEDEDDTEVEEEEADN